MFNPVYVCKNSHKILKNLSKEQTNPVIHYNPKLNYYTSIQTKCIITLENRKDVMQLFQHENRPSSRAFFKYLSIVFRWVASTHLKCSTIAAEHRKVCTAFLNKMSVFAVRGKKLKLSGKWIEQISISQSYQSILKSWQHVAKRVKLGGKYS